jgi:hypothetical protein
VLKMQVAFVDFSAHGAFVDFSSANFRLSANEPDRSVEKHTLLGSLIYRPTIFQRKDVRWIAAYTWRSEAKERGVAALKVMKNGHHPAFITEAAEPVAALIRQLFGAAPVDAVTCVPCGHSRRPDCFGKRLAKAVAEALAVPFVQVFADRPRDGVSHPKQSANLPPLRQIARPPRSMIVVDDLATSGGHLEQAVLALRQLGVAASAVAWISGSRAGGAPLGGGAAELGAEEPPPLHDQADPDVAAIAGRVGRSAPSGSASFDGAAV